MSAFPHVYTTTAQGTSTDFLNLTSEGLPSIQVSPPPQFGGPEGYWNPEAFFSAAISTCFILTFRAVSRMMKINWSHINVDVDAQLDKKDSKLAFYVVDIFVTLTVAKDQDVEAATNALKKSEESCLITNSISSQIELHVKVVHDS